MQLVVKENWPKYRSIPLENILKYITINDDLSGLPFGSVNIAVSLEFTEISKFCLFFLLFFRYWHYFRCLNHLQIFGSEMQNISPNYTISKINQISIYYQRIDKIIKSVRNFFVLLMVFKSIKTFTKNAF